ncbi:MAG: hypothetical protein C0506_06980 [Anaerolinea sp.]|nr:hypothetical protein [Anaerolinea sp.]
MGAATRLNEVSTVEEHVRAFSNQDWAAWAKSVHPDATYQEYATNRMIKGPEAIIEGLKKWTAAFPDLKGTVTNTVAEGNRVAIEVTWTGTHRGTLEGPMGAISPTGRQGDVHGVEVFTFEGERIKEMRHYFDTMELLRALGVMPAG